MTGSQPAVGVATEARDPRLAAGPPAATRAPADGGPEGRGARDPTATAAVRATAPLAPGAGEDARDLTDQELGRVIAVGALVGSVAVFVLVAGLCLALGTGLGQAAGVAAVPAFFGGWFYGGAALMLRAADRAGPVARPPSAGLLERATTGPRGAWSRHLGPRAVRGRRARSRPRRGPARAVAQRHVRGRWGRTRGHLGRARPASTWAAGWKHVSWCDPYDLVVASKSPAAPRRCEALPLLAGGGRRAPTSASGNGGRRA